MCYSIYNFHFILRLETLYAIFHVFIYRGMTGVFVENLNVCLALAFGALMGSQNDFQHVYKTGRIITDVIIVGLSLLRTKG